MSPEVWRPVAVPATVIARFEPVDLVLWRSMDNNTKARVGKMRFLDLPGALDATADRVQGWLETLGITIEGRNWVEVTVAPDLPPRFVNLGYTARCVDAFLDSEDGLMGVELKVSGSDGVCGLTLSEARLLIRGVTRVFSVNPVRGLIGEMDTATLLSVPRRFDNIPVGEARVQWRGLSESSFV